MIRSAPPAALAAILATATAALSGSDPLTAHVPPEWSAEKCRLYGDAWEAARAMFGTDGLGPAFLARHDAFLASGCTRAHDVCPAAPAERRMADTLTMMSMGEGMASTFAPFAGPDR